MVNEAKCSSSFLLFLLYLYPPSCFDFVHSFSFVLPDLRIVLIGGKQSGKTSAINTLIGVKSTVETAHCQKTEAVVNGQELTLIDTPGYWRDLFLCDTAECIKHELLLSHTLCSPGPHAVILVLELDIPFTDEIRRTVQEHTELLGTDVWKHAIILFTRRRSIEADGVTIEQHIEREGQALRWLVDKCEGRYHSFENEDPEDGTQVAELLEMIKEMAARGGHFEPDGDKLKEIEERRRLVTDRAMARQSRVKQHRERIQNGGESHTTKAYNNFFFFYCVNSVRRRKGVTLQPFIAIPEPNDVSLC